MYGAYHPEYTTQRWHIFIAYFVYTWMCCFVVLYWNSALPKFTVLGGILVISCLVVTIIACGSLPHSHGGYATSDFVWREWQNSTGYESDGFVFLLGMLNGAFAVGTPDAVTHLAEEVKRLAPGSEITLPALSINRSIDRAELFLSQCSVNSPLDSSQLLRTLSPSFIQSPTLTASWIARSSFR